MNTYWKNFRVTTFWESHWEAVWVIIDWLPSMFKIDFEFMKSELRRRKPWQSDITTQRKEDDENFEVLSWVYDWFSTGHPISIIVRNSNSKSSDYDKLKDVFRPNHADYTYNLKYWIRDHRWGWRSSARETVSRVIAWAIAKQFIFEKLWTQVFAYTKRIGNEIATNIDIDYIEKNKLRTWDKDIYENMIKLVENARNDWDSIWWIIECLISNPPAWIGEPVFDKIKARLASSMLSIGWIIWFEYWAWFEVTKYLWSTYNDSFINKNWKICTIRNNSSWILWWITTWEDITFRVAMKPTSSIYKEQKTVNKAWEEVNLKIEWRHDPCLLPRAIPVVEAMAAIDIMDLYLLDRINRIN